jgi:pyrroline-5-carboxylate reductase
MVDDVRRIGIVGGGGWLGSAIATALVRSRSIRPDELVCSYRSKLPRETVGCRWTTDNDELAKASDVVILCVRPSDWPALNLDAADKLVISVMAGIAIRDIRVKTRSNRVARALPNAAAELGFSFTPIYLESGFERDLQAVRMIFECCGTVDMVPLEDHIDYFTAMSGSGEAFPALLAQAMMSDAVTRGIPVEIATRAVQQVIIGAGRLQERHNLPPAETVKAFVDYNGTTAAGIIGMREAGFEKAVRKGLEAAYKKAVELSKA